MTVRAPRPRAFPRRRSVYSPPAPPATPSASPSDGVVGASDGSDIRRIVCSRPSADALPPVARGSEEPGEPCDLAAEFADEAVISESRLSGWSGWYGGLHEPGGRGPAWVSSVGGSPMNGMADWTAWWGNLWLPTMS